MIGVVLYFSNGGRADSIIQYSRGRGHKDADFKVLNSQTGKEVWIEAKNLISEKTGDISLLWLEEHLIPRYDGAGESTRKVAVVTPVFDIKLTVEGRKKLENEGIELFTLPLPVAHVILGDVKSQRSVLGSLFGEAHSLMSWVSQPLQQ